MSVNVSKTELEKLHKAAYGSGNYHLKLSGKKGIMVPLPLSPAQKKKIGLGAKSITLSRKQLNQAKNGGFLPLIPLAISAIASLFKGKGLSSHGEGLSLHGEGEGVDGGFIQLLPIIKSIISAVSGKGIDSKEVNGGVLEILGALIKKLIGQGLAMVPEDQRGGFLSAILEDSFANAPGGIMRYLTGESGKGVGKTKFSKK